MLIDGIIELRSESEQEDFVEPSCDNCDCDGGDGCGACDSCDGPMG